MSQKVSLGSKTLAQPAPVWIVGSYDEAGKPNVMCAAWGGICCSKPVCINVSLRAATHSHAGIMARKAFTVSVATESWIAQADYTGMASGRDTDKFAAAGLTPVRSELVDAPYVAEAPLVLECKVVHVAELGLHTLFVGEVLDVKCDENVLGEPSATSGSRTPLTEKLKPVVFDTGGRHYHGLGANLGPAFSIGGKYMK